MTVLTAPRTARLLFSLCGPGSSSLDSHLAVHGAAPIGTPGDAHWAARHASEIEASGLTGRGGAAFAAWRKLDAVRRASGRPTVIVNAMEGEPASAKDHVLLTRAPHLVLDGAQLTAAGTRCEGCRCLRCRRPAHCCGVGAPGHR